MNAHKNKVTYTRLEQLHGNIHTNVACKQKENNLHINTANTYINNTSFHIADKNYTTTPISIGLNKTTQVSNIKTTTKIQNL
jgi:hypothetical protein